MGDAYPELPEHRGEIARILTAEEESFSRTLSRGLRLFEEVAAGGDAISGEDAFRLHDTYGFPYELTRELAHERGLGIDEEEFTRRMEEQRERSRSAGGLQDIGLVGRARPTEFVGYEKTEVLTAICGPRAARGGASSTRSSTSRRSTPRAAARCRTPAGSSTRRPAHARRSCEAIRVGDDQVLTFDGEGFAVGDRVRAVVPWAHRFPTMANHTATHLLHEALRQVLGEHVQQAGSAVRPDKLRFDFTHTEALTTAQRHEVEEIVNRKVFENLPVRAYVTTIDEARNLGATMLFGEKYGDEVRVIEIPGFSMELCGGTHVRWTAEIGPFAILSESSVGAGARRIEAVTSGEAYALLHGHSREADELRAELERVRREQKKATAAAAAEEDLVVRYEDASVAVIEVKESATPLRDLSDRIKQQRKVGAVLLGARVDGRVQLVLNIDKGLVDRGLDASQVIREIAEAREGRRRRPPGLRRGGRAGAREARRRAGRRAGASRRRAFVKVLALDYGSARTGVAVSDPTGTIARPLGVVESATTEAGFARLRELIAEEEPERHGRRPAADPARRPGRAGPGDGALRRAAARRGGHAGRAVRRALHVRARGRRRRPSRGASALELPRVVARPLALAAAAGAAVLVAGCGGDPAKPKPTVPAGPKVLHIVFPEGFTRAEMAERIDAVRKIAEERRHVMPRITAAGYLAATASSKLPAPYSGDSKRRPLEGFLFPAKYAFFSNETARHFVGPPARRRSSRRSGKWTCAMRARRT